MSDTDSKSATPAVQNWAPKLFIDEPDRTAEALATFRLLEKCKYSIDYLGDSTNEFMECDCPEERTLVDDDEYINRACDENSDCINRLTLIECVDGLCESTCGKECQNQRFQKKQYADINVFLTEHKGYGVRAQTNLEANTFIYEYIGEVIDEEEFRDRMIQYDNRHLKHFYFMMLQTGQFIDATMKGCLARFCNHSCNPNAYVNKWVVNGKLKMGIFAKRDIVKGEEITFDYNVDRYGATAQKCYCGEPNCIGFMGGKTQTDAASLLPHIYADAMGVSASQEKKWIKAKKAEGTLDDIKNKGENGENINVEFVESLDMEPCDNVKDVTKVMSVLLQCNNQLIASMLFKRLWLTYNYEDEDDEDKTLKQILLNQVIKLHGYQCFKNILQLFQDNDYDVLRDIIEFLYHLPKSTRNGVTSSHIDEQVRSIANEYPDFEEDCNQLLQRWNSFDTYTRITKKDISNASSTTSMKKLMDQRRIRLPPGWEIIQENGRPLYFNREQNRKLVDPPISQSDHNNRTTSVDRRNRTASKGPLGLGHNNDSEYHLGDKRSYSSRDIHRSEDFAMKKKRIELEEQQMLLRAKEEEEKREKERFKQETERRNILDQIISDVGKSKELQREQSLKLEEEKRRKHHERKINSQLSHLEHKWEKFFASFVPNMVKKYNTDINLSHDAIKQCSRDIVKTLSNKEAKRGSENSPPKKMDKYKYEKVKNFVNQYMEKFTQKYNDKKFKTSQAS